MRHLNIISGHTKDGNTENSVQVQFLKTSSNQQSLTFNHYCPIKKEAKLMAAKKTCNCMLQNSNNDGRNKYFLTKSVFGQLISLIDDKIIKDAVKKERFR